MDVRGLKLRTLWAIGQVAADIAKFVMIVGCALLRLGNKLQDWVDRR